MNKEIKEQAHKEFNYLFGYEISEVQKEFSRYLSHDPDIWNFIDSLIDKTVQMTEERIVGFIKDWTPTKYTGYGVSPIAMTLDDHKRNFSKELISLITNKNDINNNKE